MPSSMTIPAELLLKSSVIKMLRLSASILVRNIGLMLGILALVIVPLDLAVSAAGRQIYRAIGTPQMHDDIGLVLSFYFFMFSGLVSTTLIALVVSQLIEGERPTFHKTYSQITGPRLLKVLGTVFLVAAISIVPLTAYFSLAYAAYREPALLPLKLLLYPIAAIISIVVSIDCLFGSCVAVFEHTYFWQAFVRSRRLAKGRRVWMAKTLFGGLILAFLLVSPAVLLSYFVETPKAGFASAAGFVRLLLEKLGSSLFDTVISIFLALVYFRRRRELHDLTFYELPDSSIIRPASQLLEA
jgi:hypothetical protein